MKNFLLAILLVMGLIYVPPTMAGSWSTTFDNSNGITVHNGNWTIPNDLTWSNGPDDSPNNHKASTNVSGTPESDHSLEKSAYVGATHYQYAEIEFQVPSGINSHMALGASCHFDGTGWMGYFAFLGNDVDRLGEYKGPYGVYLAIEEAYKLGRKLR